MIAIRFRRFGNVAVIYFGVASSFFARTLQWIIPLSCHGSRDWSRGAPPCYGGTRKGHTVPPFFCFYNYRASPRGRGRGRSVRSWNQLNFRPWSQRLLIKSFILITALKSIASPTSSCEFVCSILLILSNPTYRFHHHIIALSAYIRVSISLKVMRLDSDHALQPVLFCGVGWSK